MNVFVEKYILISGFLAFLEIKVLEKVLILMFAWSVQMISGLDSQSKFQMFLHYFSAAMLVSLGGTQTWRLHTGLCEFVQNISTNIWRSEKCTDLITGEVS